jgi:hypothetical protein
VIVLRRAARARSSSTARVAAASAASGGEQGVPPAGQAADHDGVDGDLVHRSDDLPGRQDVPAGCLAGQAAASTFTAATWPAVDGGLILPVRPCAAARPVRWRHNLASGRDQPWGWFRKR